MRRILGGFGVEERPPGTGPGDGADGGSVESVVVTSPPPDTAPSEFFLRDLPLFLDHLAVEKGLAENSLEAYRRDLTAFGRHLDEEGALGRRRRTGGPRPVVRAAPFRRGLAPVDRPGDLGPAGLLPVPLLRRRGFRPTRPRASRTPAGG